MANRLNGFIYAVKNPITNVAVYIGMTTNSIKNRYSTHLWCARKPGRKNRFHSWLRSQLNKGIIPPVVLLETVENSNLIEKEIYYIKFFKEKGIKLLNDQPGGEGQPKGYEFKKRYIPPKGKTPEHLKYFILNSPQKGIKKSKESIDKGNITRLKNKKLCQPVVLLKDGKELKFHSARAAARAINARAPNMINALNSKTRRRVKGYSVRWDNADFAIEGKRVLVTKYNDHHCINYESISDAANQNKIKRDTIYNALKNNKCVKGYFWRKTYE